jgi:4-amino-4-deoxy-L-arabinose transferase-like glycosyltransferase
MNKIVHSHFWLLAGLITLVSLLVRLDRLTTNPEVLNPDEVSIAYNAKLLVESGKDEWGRQWPLVLEAFGDQKVIGYTATVSLAFSLFGFHDWAVRLPALIATIILLPLTAWFLVRIQAPKPVALLATAFLALMPVFFFYSRIGFEAVPSLIMVVVLIMALIEQPRAFTIPIMVIAGSLAILFYNSPLVLMPFLGLIPIYWQGIRRIKRWLPVLIVLLLVWGIWFGSLHNMWGQKSRITLFNDATVRAEYLQYRESLPDWAKRVAGNQYSYYAARVGYNYVGLFNPGFLLFNHSGHPWHSTEGYGYVTISLLIMAVIGLVGAVYHRRQLPKWLLLCLGLLLISPLPSAITVNAPHATRSLLFFWTLSLMAAYGFVTLAGIGRLGRYLALVLFGLMIIEFGLYIHDYQRSFPEQSRRMWQDRLYPTLREIQNERPETRVLVYDPRGFEYVRAAWYGNLPASEYFATVAKSPPDIINFRYATNLGEWEFTRDRPTYLQDDQVMVFWNGRDWEIQ